MVRLLGNDTREGFCLAPLFTLSGSLTVISLTHDIAKRIPNFSFPKILTSSSFFVYALHIEFALPLGFFITKALFKEVEDPALLTVQYVLTPCIIYVICLAVFVCLKNISPRLLSLLNGNR